jgi:hypothetical protein
MRTRGGEEGGRFLELEWHAKGNIFFFSFVNKREGQILLYHITYKHNTCH